MDRLQICGGKPLKGEVFISGAKNAALPELCAALLTDEPLVLDNCPKLNDVNTMETLLSQMGVGVERNAPHRVTLDGASIAWPLAPYELVKTMRASILTLGPLLARCGRARVSMPGGCAIGLRPIDQHIKALAQMGAEIDLKHGYIAAQSQRLTGADITFNMPTVTGTENVMMAATLAKGVTTLHNAAREPEIVDLANLLTAMGARIQGAGESLIVIEGVERLHGATHRVMPDRIESGTFLAAAAATRGSIILRRTDAKALAPVLEVMRKIGLDIKVSNDDQGDQIALSHRGNYDAFHLVTAPHPGFPTDMQAQMMALAIAADGISTITETIFESRMMHVQELVRLGASIEVDGNTARVTGGTPLSGATVMATDLRASASLVIAALMAEGVTTIDRIYHLDRGYEAMEAKLSALGAEVLRIE
ncbi:MAG: UDP-N-acetylglucosamine 1-carboxyvinyltransferase [Burkholderiales bacterium]|jgi:UDP-N-acetylglucosamine 1-carboxyvinyltransferase|nr:UDP-N-acetylglucosamine 1-carboxyvinyltransferase [Burkholderiales bacterium]